MQIMNINGEALTSILEKPIKYLGKWYNKKLSDREQEEEVQIQVKRSLRKIDKSLLPGKYRAWCLQNVLMPKIMWPLSIYHMTAGSVVKIEHLITAAIKRWLGLPRSLCSAALYGKTMKLQLPFSSVTEEVKVTKTRNVVILEDSKDERIQKAGIRIKIGRKWDARREMEEAKAALHHQEIAGISNVGREGIGFTPRQYYSKVDKQERRKMIVKKVRQKEEQQRMVKIAGLAKQSSSMKWEVEERRVKLEDLWKLEESRLRFLVKSVYDLLPTPQNKNVWYNTEEHKCALCGEKGTLYHILSACKVALAQGRYTYRHNKVLRALAEMVENERLKNNAIKGSQNFSINFVKEGQKGTLGRRRKDKSYFGTSKDWIMRVDLDKQLKIPEQIARTRKRPDMILYSYEIKHIVMIELTVPHEDRIGLAHELKESKYGDLRQECERNGWRCEVWPVEIGVRGFAGRSIL